ncbi:hypothetical protein CH373_09060 [Leptospira perolatii]|uniref:Uncharacterized protein n=1 Tax=Leptospira perolatii TaxID=2023191 RepID=A0A2M9ZNG4_9LEPT|nr:hypothetical protein CH360_10205 [Leptospira perolatii]PJZ73628.1 hypothetical protein CH373_09060 [Leptospira perolatii]
MEEAAKSFRSSPNLGSDRRKAKTQMQTRQNCLDLILPLENLPAVCICRAGAFLRDLPQNLKVI